METLTLRIKSDLRRYKHQIYTLNKDRWRLIQVSVFGACLLLLIIAIVDKPLQIKYIFPLLLFSPIFLIIAIKEGFRQLTKPLLRGFLVILVFLLLSIAGGILHPSVPSEMALPSWLVVLFPVITIPILVRIFRDAPRMARQFSLRPYQPIVNLFTGLFIGAIFALHFFLLVRFIPTINNSYITFSPGALLWFFGILAGLVIPAEELLLRGSAFSLHHDDLANRFSSTAMRIMVLNGIIYLVLLIYNLAEPELLLIGLLAVIYKVILAFITTFIIFRRRNLLAGFAANLVFTFLAGQIFFL